MSFGFKSWPLIDTHRQPILIIQPIFIKRRSSFNNLAAVCRLVNSKHERRFRCQTVRIPRVTLGLNGLLSCQGLSDRKRDAASGAGAAAPWGSLTPVTSRTWSWFSGALFFLVCHLALTSSSAFTPAAAPLVGIPLKFVLIANKHIIAAMVMTDFCKGFVLVVGLTPLDPEVKRVCCVSATDGSGSEPEWFCGRASSKLHEPSWISRKGEA